MYIIHVHTHTHTRIYARRKYCAAAEVPVFTVNWIIWSRDPPRSIGTLILIINRCNKYMLAHYCNTVFRTFYVKQNRTFSDLNRKLLTVQCSAKRRAEGCTILGHNSPPVSLLRHSYSKFKIAKKKKSPHFKRLLYLGGFWYPRFSASFFFIIWILDIWSQNFFPRSTALHYPDIVTVLYTWC